MDTVLRANGRNRVIWAVGALALAWNAYGVVQFLGSLSATPEQLVASGLSAEQAAVMTGYPLWMTVAFAIGVFGGLAGSVLLLMRNRLAEPVFHASLAGYIALYAGDIVHGVFAAMGAPQIIILSVVVAIAAGLSWFSRRQAFAGIWPDPFASRCAYTLQPTSGDNDAIHDDIQRAAIRICPTRKR